MAGGGPREGKTLFKKLFGRTPATPAEPAPVPELEQIPPRPRIVDVGWLLDTEKARFIWPEPRRVTLDNPPPRHAKAAGHCPAVAEHEARMFEMLCPIDVRLGFKRGERGEPQLVNLDSDAASIRTKHLGEMVSMVSEREWRHPDRPMIQIITPYVFVADEPVWAMQLPPVTHYLKDPWPGLLFGGRIPIHIWPRQLMWAFEWFEPAKPLVLRRGQPWFNVRFEASDPERPVRLFEAERTPELIEHIQGLTAVSNYVDRTLSLYKVAAERRPPRLLMRKTRGGEPVAADEPDPIP